MEPVNRIADSSTAYCFPEQRRFIYYADIIITIEEDLQMLPNCIDCMALLMKSDKQMRLKGYKIRQFCFTGERWLDVKCLILGFSEKN